MRPSLRRLLLWLGSAGVVGLTAVCTGTTGGPSGGTLALGTWGGDNAGVIATDTVTHVHVGCTFGDIPGDIELDEAGRFTVDGSYVLRAYPIMVGPPLPAQFSGQVRGRILTLAIAVNDTVEKKVVALGPVTVSYGREPQMGPCPICATPREGYPSSLAPWLLSPSTPIISATRRPVMPYPKKHRGRRKRGSSWRRQRRKRRQRR